MRSLLIPAGVVAFGLLAALPFRRSVESPSPPPVEAIGLPDTVTPLREAPLAAEGRGTPAALARSLTKGRLASMPLPTSHPSVPPIGSLSTSYQEVAVPLALPEDPGNLLDSALDRSREPSASFGRFGIAQIPRAGDPGDASPERTAAELAGSVWETARAIPGLEPTSALASVLEPQPSEPRAESKPSGPFQTVSNAGPTPPEAAPPRKRMFIREPK